MLHLRSLRQITSWALLSLINSASWSCLCTCNHALDTVFFRRHQDLAAVLQPAGLYIVQDLNDLWSVKMKIRFSVMKGNLQVQEI